MGVGIAEKSWLYLNGHAVICDRHMEVVSIVNGINPAINGSMDSVELGSLQQVTMATGQGRMTMGVCISVVSCRWLTATAHPKIEVVLHGRASLILMPPKCYFSLMPSRCLFSLMPSGCLFSLMPSRWSFSLKLSI